MPEPTLYERVTGSAPAPTPAAAPSPEASDLYQRITGIPRDPVLDHSQDVLDRVSATQNYIDGTGSYPPQLDHNQRPDSGTQDQRLQWSGPDDRTILQRFVLGTGRQVAGAGLDFVLGIPAAGMTWLAAGTAATARALGGDQSDEFMKLAHGMNQISGTLLRVTDEVAGRPVVTLPDWVPFFGGQDAIRTLAAFAPIPFIGGTTAARVATSLPMRAAEALGIDVAKTSGKIAAHLGAAVGTQLALTEGRPAYDLATAKTSGEATAALKEAGQAAIASGMMGAAFFGLGYGFDKWKTGLENRAKTIRAGVQAYNEEAASQPLRALEAANAKRAATAAEKAMALATMNDTLRAGTPIGDADARAARAVADAKANPAPPMQGPIPVDRVGMGGMDLFRSRNGKIYMFQDWVGEERSGRLKVVEYNPDTGTFTGNPVTRNLADLQWVKPTLDPNVAVPALRSADGQVVIGEGATHVSAWNQYQHLGLPHEGMDSGWVWGPEKKFYTREQLAEAQGSRAERQKALVEMESADRLTEVAVDAARGESSHGEGREPMTGEERQAFQFFEKQMREGKNWHDPNIRGDLPQGVKGWFGVRHVLNMLDAAKRPGSFMTPEERQGTLDIKGKMSLMIHQGNVLGEKLYNEAVALFPRGKPGEPNWGGLAQMAAGTKDPVNFALATSGMNEAQQGFLKEGIVKVMEEMRDVRSASGVQGEKEFLKDYFVRNWKLPEERAIHFFEKEWDKLEIGPVRDMHTFHRVFKIWESALKEGITPRFDHIGTLLRDYAISTHESAAKTIAKQQALELGGMNDLVSKGKVPGWVKMGNGKDPYFGGRYVAPDFAKAITPLFERPPQMAWLRNVDKINYVSKRYGLGLDFYQIMQSVRSMAGISLNPVSEVRAYKGAKDAISRDPEMMAMIAESGVRLDELSGSMAKDILAHKERREAFVAEGAVKSTLRHPLDGIRYLFDKVEEFSMREAFTVGKVMRTMHETSQWEAKFSRDNNRLPTREEKLSFMKRIAEDTNNIFGGLNYSTLSRSAGMRALSRMVLLAPDWTESRLRLYTRALAQGTDVVTAPIREVFGERGAMARSLARENTGAVRSAVTMAASMGLLTEAMNLALNGHLTNKNAKENQYYVQLPFQTKYGSHPGVNLWGYSEMPLRMLEHFVKLEPEAFFNERRAPGMNLMFTWLANQDNFGQSLKGDVPFMRPPVSESDRTKKVLLQKVLTTAGMVVPSFIVDMGVAMDRTMRDGALDQVRWLRSVGGYFAVKVSSGYPQELRQRLQFFEDNESWIKGEYKRLKAQGRYDSALDLRNDWNGNLNELKQQIAADPTAAHVFGRRKRVVDMMRIAH